MKVGYARVSTFEQDLDLQLDALNANGCDRIINTIYKTGSKGHILTLGHGILPGTPEENDVIPMLSI